MALVNVENMLMQRAWALLEANTGVTDKVREGNRIRLTGSKWVLKTTWNDGDFPELTVAYPTMVHSMYALGRGYDFGMSGFNPAVVDVPVDLDVAMNVECVHQYQDAGPVGLLNAAILQALYAGGPRWLRVGGAVTPLALERLQLAGPVRVSTTIANARPLGTSGDGSPRPVTVFVVPLKLRTHGPALLA